MTLSAQARAVNASADILGLRSRALERHLEPHTLSLRNMPRTYAGVTALAQRLKGLGGQRYATLADVAASYAVLTLQHSYAPAELAYPYAPFLLAGWIWDDTVDTNKGHPHIDEAIALGIDWLCRATAAPVSLELARVDLARLKDSELSTRILDAVQLLSYSIRQVEIATPEYKGRIGREVRRFVAAFAAKVRFTHRRRLDFNTFMATRAVCVGTQPSCEFSYAAKAVRDGVAHAKLEGLLARETAKRCEEIACLHCAAVNDLFSLYKDRHREDTQNLAVILGAGRDLTGYFDGAVRTLRYVGQLYEEFVSHVHALPAGPETEVAIEAWREMMEGNVIFHLSVPRYRESVPVLLDLMNPHYPQARRRELFLRGMQTNMAG